MAFQILFLIFSTFAIGNVVLRRREGALGPKGMIFWILFWLAADVAMVWPNSTTVIANRLGIGRGADLVVYVALAALFFLLFKLHIKIESVGRDVTRVVRRDALNGADKNK